MATKDVLPRNEWTEMATLRQRIERLERARSASPGDVKASGRRTAPTGWLLCDGAAVSRTTYADLFDAIVPSLGTFTVTIASPGVFTLNSHGLQEGDTVYLTTTGALPTGLSANTLYFVIAAGLSSNNFRLATTRGGAAINTSGSQSGTHTLRHCPFGLGDGSTTFNVPNFKGKVLVGRDSGDAVFALGETGGAKTHTLTIAEMPAHNHGGATGGSSENTDTTAGAARQFPAAGSSSGFGGTHTHSISSQGGDGAHNNVQPYNTVNWLIKT